MNVQLLLLLAGLSAFPATEAPAPIYSMSPDLMNAVRGQSPGVDSSPFYTTPITVPDATGYGTPTYAPMQPDGNSVYYNPMPAQPLMQDPFQAGAVPYSAVPTPYTYGVNGPQPYRFGWKSRADFGYLAPADVESSVSELEIFELDTELKHTSPLPTGWIFSTGPQFDLRVWDIDPGSNVEFYRFGWLFDFALPASGPWSVQLTANPSINTDFEDTLTSYAYNWDGWGILFYRASPEWLFAIGAGYWDRVNDYVIPYAGVVWTPDQYWELRLLFPESRISYFAGNMFGMPTWLYVNGEYHVESYEADTGFTNQVEIEDWRLTAGIRTDEGYCTKFIEAGWVFGRRIEFRKVFPGVDVDNGFIARAGIRF